MRLTELEYQEMEARLARGRKKGAPSAPDDAGEAFVGREAELHRQIEDELIRRRWYFVHSRTDRKTTQKKGVTDFIVAAPFSPPFGEPKTFWIEIKRKGGKLTKEQTATRHVLLALGHRWSVVYSFEEFLREIEQ